MNTFLSQYGLAIITIVAAGLFLAFYRYSMTASSDTYNSYVAGLNGVKTTENGEEIKIDDEMSLGIPLELEDNTSPHFENLPNKTLNICIENNSVDQDNDGIISRDDFLQWTGIRAVKSNGVQIPNDEITILVYEIDYIYDDNGQYTYGYADVLDSYGNTILDDNGNAIQTYQPIYNMLYKGYWINNSIKNKLNESQLLEQTFLEDVQLNFKRQTKYKFVFRIEENRLKAEKSILVTLEHK